ncbi:MAG: hypothetical protein M3Q58_12095 [Bacteroidota bacterium]|nr:hypothetical protein [Bacteroidota bacterium]
MKTYFKPSLLLLFLTIALSVVSQEKLVKSGDKFYNQNLFSKAIESYEKSLSKIKSDRKPYVMGQIANSYDQLFDYRNAAKWYSKLIEFSDLPDDTYYNYGNALRNLGNYQEALSQYKKYCEQSGNQQMLSKFETICAWPDSEEAKKNAPFDIYETDLLIGNKALGMTFFENRVLFSKPKSDEKTGLIVFNDLAYAEIIDSVSFGQGEILKNISSKFYDATPSINSENNILFFSSNSTLDKKAKKEVPKDKANIENPLKIYYSVKTGSEWSKPERVSFDNGEFNFSFPFISADGKTLYFSSDMPGGFGKMDIYRIERTGENQWGNPVNLGPEINTGQDEIYPLIADNNFYFSSRGHEGFGGLDIYSSEIKSTGFSKPRNMLNPVNSPGDDFNFILKANEGWGYLSSNRGSNSNMDLVYRMQAKISLDTISGIVRDENGNDPIEGVTVKIYSVNEETGELSLFNSFVTGKDGKWEFIVEPGKNWKTEFERDGYVEKDMLVSKPSSGKNLNDGNQYSVLLQKIEVLAKVPDSNLELSYTVQIGAYRKPKNFKYNSLKSLGTVENKTLNDGIARFLIGSFNDANQAIEFKKKIVQLGFKDALVIGIQNGERVSRPELAGQ